MFAPDTVALTGYPLYARRQRFEQFQFSIRAKGMTTFDKREEAFEKQFAHDEELRFKATARRNKLLGLWAAEKLGIERRRGGQLRQVGRDGRFRRAGDHDVLRKIRKDFDAKGVAQSDHQIGRVMSELMEKAIADIKAGK